VPVSPGLDQPRRNTWEPSATRSSRTLKKRR
jgi:hypothetical protein